MFHRALWLWALKCVCWRLLTNFALYYCTRLRGISEVCAKWQHQQKWTESFFVLFFCFSLFILLSSYLYKNNFHIAQVQGVAAIDFFFTPKEYALLFLLWPFFFPFRIFTCFIYGMIIHSSEASFVGGFKCVVNKSNHRYFLWMRFIQYSQWKTPKPKLDDFSFS